MNRKKRILQPNQSHNENHEGRINMPQNFNGTFDVHTHYPSTNICSNKVLNPIMFNTQIDDTTRNKGKSVMLEKSVSGTNINMIMHQPPIRASKNISSIPKTCKSLNIKSCSCRKEYVSYCCIMFY